MKNIEIIKKAQAECNETITGYKRDISQDSLKVICEMMWKRSINLMYDFSEFRMEMQKCIGALMYSFYLVDILDFIQDKVNAGKYCNFHGNRYCA